MQNVQKKPYKKYFNKSKTYTSDNYEYDSFGDPAHQNNFHKPNNTYKYSKTKKYYNEYNPYQPVTTNYVQAHKPESQNKEYHPHQNKDPSQQDKWLHDKYAETTENPPSGPKSTPNINQPKSKAKPYKRPDKQLYSVRNKHAHGEEQSKSEVLDTSEIHGHSEDIGSEAGSNGPQDASTDRAAKMNMEKLEQVSQTSVLKSILRIGEEGHPFEEDKSFVSNVSTAISDKLRNYEDESGSYEKKAQMVERGQNLRGPPPKMVLEMTLQSMKGMETIRIFENEENYEGLLETICRNHGFSNRMTLYFKIHILQTIYDKSYDKSRVEPILRDLVEINTRLILYQNGLQEFDESIRPYLEIPNAPVFWPDPAMAMQNMNRRPNNIRFVNTSTNSL